MLSDLPPNIASYGGEVDSVFAFIWYIVLFWFVVAEAALVYCLVSYRRKPGVRATWLPADTAATNAWVLVPALVILGFDLAIEARSHHAWDLIKLQLPAHDELVRITARQFVWTFTHAGADGRLDTRDDIQEVSELHVPAGKVVRFELTSHDVLHSFWVPALRLKQDAVPGRAFPGWFEATGEGDHEIACAELCGAAHTVMRAVLRVRPPAEHAAWADAMAEQQSLTASSDALASLVSPPEALARP